MGGKYNDLVYTGMSIYQYIPVYPPGSNLCRGSKVPEERRMVLSDADSLGKAAKPGVSREAFP